jgi:hypothetical protein
LLRPFLRLSREPFNRSHRRGIRPRQPLKHVTERAPSPLVAHEAASDAKRMSEGISS